MWNIHPPLTSWKDGNVIAFLLAISLLSRYIHDATPGDFPAVAILKN